jgi:hypothetical protein
MNLTREQKLQEVLQNILDCCEYDVANVPHPLIRKARQIMEVSQEITPDWNTCLQISEVPEVDSALRKFAEGETTEDQAVCIVQSVLQAVKTLNFTQD